jgi:hypothetical protein
VRFGFLFCFLFGCCCWFFVCGGFCGLFFGVCLGFGLVFGVCLVVVVDGLSWNYSYELLGLHFGCRVDCEG